MMIIRGNDPVVDDGYFSYFQIVEGLGGGIELCLEAHRYFDARRWMTAAQEFSEPLYGISIVKDKNSDKKVYTRFKFQDRHFPEQYYLQPIPIGEIQRSGIAQNDGY